MDLASEPDLKKLKVEAELHPPQSASSLQPNPEAHTSLPMSIDLDMEPENGTSGLPIGTGTAQISAAGVPLNSNAFPASALSNESPSVKPDPVLEMPHPVKPPTGALGPQNGRNKSDTSRLVISNASTSHMDIYVLELKAKGSAVVEVSVTDHKSVPEPSKFQSVHICIAYSSSFAQTLAQFTDFLEKCSHVLRQCNEVSCHVDFSDPHEWSKVDAATKQAYVAFLESLGAAAAEKVVQFSCIRKYDSSTVFVTEKDELVSLGKEIQGDLSRWLNLRILDYGENSIRLVPGVKLPDCLQVLNLGGGHSLETLAGFKMPALLVCLDASNNCISSIDYISFPSSLRKLNLQNNRIYFLNYADFPHQLETLDVSQNRLDSLKNVNFPRGLRFLSVSGNPIECIKGVRFPDSIEYLDVSCIPNEAMTGIKFPDLTVSLNLQLSMTNPRGLKLPPALKHLNLASNGVNSINPLKLPDTIETLFLANNNIKTLNKVAFPPMLRELYLGNNLLTTLKNVQFPMTLEVLDLTMDPFVEDNEKYITSLKDVSLPPNLRVLRLGHQLIKVMDGIELPFHLQELTLEYNDLRVFKNVTFGPHLRVLDLLGNQDLMSMETVYFPDSLADLRVLPLLLANLPAQLVERANRRELKLAKSLPFTV